MTNGNHLNYLNIHKFIYMEVSLSGGHPPNLTFSLEYISIASIDLRPYFIKYFMQHANL